jgi:ElaB/YqjD/DUF883 family membrane-anchored ribosome-binding protein
MFGLDGTNLGPAHSRSEAPASFKLKETIMTGPSSHSGNSAASSERAHTITSDLSALKSDAAHLVGDLGAAASAQASNAVSAVNGAAHTAVQGAETMVSTGSAQLQTAVRAQPLTAIAIAAGIGALAGVYLRR